MVKLITKKQPEIILKKEELLESRHWIIIHNIYKMKHYTIFYDYREHIFVNPGIKDYERILEILQSIFVCRYINNKLEKLFVELKALTDKETDSAVLTMWYDWRESVRKLELNEQANAALKAAKSNCLYCKSRKQKDIIKELFDIGFGLYEPKAECNWQQGAENAFMYGYLMGMKANSSDVAKGGAMT